jgi:putative sigma-54 modulation protein
MHLNITFRQMEATDSLKDFVRERVERVHKYLDRAGEAHVVLSLERHLHHADITIHSGKFLLRGEEKTEDMYVSIEKAMDKIEKQFLRYKDRLKHHHGKKYEHHQEKVLNNMKVRHNVIEHVAPEDAPEAEQALRVVATHELEAKTLTVDEAVMQMDLMNNDFLVFTDSATNKVTVLYRRNEGKFGLIEASEIAESRGVKLASGA